MEADVRRLLNGRGREWSAPIQWLESAGSTNGLMKESARAGAPAWSAIVAGRQTAGRGRQGRAWLSPAGNLFLSVLLRPELAPAVLDRLAVWYDALARDGPPAVLTAWRARSVPWWGQAVEARCGDAVLRGVARGLDGRGALILDLADGSQRAVFSGEVRELRLES